MDRLLLIFFGFLAGEILLYFLVSRGYDRMVRQGFAPPRLSLKRTVLLISLLLPAGYAALAFFGLLVVSAAPGLQIGPLAQNPPPVDIEFPDIAIPTPTLEPTPGPDALPPDSRPRTETPFTPTPEPTPTEIPEEEVYVPDPPSLWPGSPEVAGEIPPGKIVYTCQIYLTRFRDQICIMNTDGTGYRRLTEDSQSAHNFASLAPDGQSVVYVHKPQEGVSDIYEMDLETGQAVQLTFGLGDASAPEISPDGGRIVYNLFLEGANTIWVMDRDGGNAQMLIGPPRGNGWDPVWSPDGEWILFASDREVGVQLFAITADGSELRQVTNLQFLRGRSAWSSDGTKIATYVGEPWQREIVVMDPDGANPRIITQGGNNLAPSFSPDGSWIVFTSYRDKYREELGCEIYIMRSDGTGITRLTADDICNWQPRWGR
jgi:TolB protein